jgi:hypothetical protein
MRKMWLFDGFREWTIGNRLRIRWIPASAGMTEKWARMTEKE